LLHNIDIVSHRPNSYIWWDKVRKRSVALVDWHNYSNNERLWSKYGRMTDTILKRNHHKLTSVITGLSQHGSVDIVDQVCLVGMSLSKQSELKLLAQIHQRDESASMVADLT
jgi:hypothetical protein